MTLLGQHGQRLDYQQGVDFIRYSAQTADENAPQGAYVSHSRDRNRNASAETNLLRRSLVCYKLMTYLRSIYQSSICRWTLLVRGST